MAVYSAKLLDHFEHPRGAGELPDATHRARVENPACGDVVELSLRILNGVIEQAAFKAKGCVPAMACASATAELVGGKKVAEASRISREQIRQAVDDVPPASGHALDLAVDAIRAALSRPLKG
jgi:nitrogen fixation protein NifU and related proteins